MKPLAYVIVSALLIIVLAGGIVIGVKVMAPIHAREIAAVRAERDAARRDADACFMALKVLGEGGRSGNGTLARVRFQGEGRKHAGRRGELAMADGYWGFSHYIAKP